MKKLSKKAVALLMSLCLGTTLCPVAGVAAAQSDDILSAASQVQIEPRYSYIVSTSVYFFPSGFFGINVSCTNDVDTIKITVQLQEKVGVWSSVGDPLKKSCAGNEGYFNDSFDLDSSGTYRIKVTFQAITPNGSETIVKYAEI